MSTATENKLFNMAREVMKNAYAPYSKYFVGAAILSTNGNYYKGCNVENAAYPQGLCAEASAIASMVAGNDLSIAEIYVIANSKQDVAPPCGGCRQKIREFANSNTIITICNLNGVVKSYSMNELLPDSFGPENLKNS